MNSIPLTKRWHTLHGVGNSVAPGHGDCPLEKKLQHGRSGHSQGSHDLWFWLLLFFFCSFDTSSSHLWSRNLNGRVAFLRLACRHFYETFYFSKIYFYFMSMGILPACMSIHHTCTIPGEEGKSVRPQVEELQMVESHSVGPGSWTWVLWKKRQSS